MSADKRVAHLEMLQAIILRMASNSFLLKAWTVSVVSGLFALAAANSNMRFAYLAFLPSVLFGTLDAFFLREERRYRALFDHIRLLPETEVSFSMDARNLATPACSWLRAASSWSILAFYGGLLGTILLVCRYPMIQA